MPTYDLIGTNQAGEKLLESLLARITPTNTMAIRDVLIVYRPNQSSDRASGLQYDGEDHYKAFLIRANLSTETESVIQFTGTQGKWNDLPKSSNALPYVVETNLAASPVTINSGAINHRS